MPIGVIVVNWNFVEYSLDTCVKVIYHDYGGKTILKKYENQVPVSMTSKTELLEMCLRKKDNLISFKTQGLSLVKRSLALSKERNTIIHMRLKAKNPDGSFTFIKTDYKSIHEYRQVTYTLNQFCDFGKEIIYLGNDLVDFATRLLD